MQSLEKRQPRAQVLLGFVIFGVFVAGLIMALRYLFGLFADMDTQRAVALVTASATVIVSVLSVMGGRYLERKAAIESELRQVKLPIYEEFIGFMFRVLFGEKMGNKLSEEDIIDNLASFTQKFTLWGSDRVIREYGKMRASFIKLSQDAKYSTVSMFQFEELLKAIRVDMGYKNRGLRKGDILRLFVNDVDEYLDM